MEYLRSIRLCPSNLTIPSFDKKILEDDQIHQVIIDQDGVKKKILKEYRLESMDQWLEYPVKDRKDWHKYKKRLNPDSLARFPCWWEEEKEKYKNLDYPIGIDVGSFFGWIRSWVGIENLSYLTMDDPALIEEVEEYIEYFILSILKKVLKEDNIKPDFALFF